jgi:hypothetical protein
VSWKAAQETAVSRWGATLTLSTTGKVHYADIAVKVNIDSLRTIAPGLFKGSILAVAELRIRDLDGDLHKALRHLAVEKGVSLNQLVKDLLADAIERQPRKR